MYADEIQKKIEAIKKEIHDTPYDKSSQFHHGVLKAKLAKFNDMLEEKKSGGGGGGVGYAIKHSGDASVVLVGLPSVGKSTLLNAVTNAVSKIGNYDFTTLGVVPGMMEYKGVRIQILDLPGIIEGAAKGKGFGRKVLSVVRASDLVVLMADYKRIDWISKIKNEMEESGVRLNKRPPKIHVIKMGKGGIQIIDPYKILSEEMMIEVAKEMGLDNAVIQIGEKVENIDVFIDGLSKSRTYIPLVEVVTKMDEVKNLSSVKGDFVKISAKNGIGIEEFKERVWQGLGRVRVYLKSERTSEADFKEPLIMKRGQRLRDVAKRISSQLRDDINKAYIWGKEAKFPGQEVSLHFEVFDEMEVWFSR